MNAGNFILLNVFLAIAVDNLQTEEEKAQQDEEALAKAAAEQKALEEAVGFSLNLHITVVYLAS